MNQVMEGYERLENWSSANSVAEMIIRLEPTSIPHYQKRVEYAYREEDRGRLLQAYLDLADSLFRTGSLDNARSIYERVLDMDPDNVLAQAALESLAPEPEPALPEPELILADEAEPSVVEAVPEVADEPAVPRAAPMPEAPAGGDFIDLGSFILGDDEPVKDTRMRIDRKEPEEGQEQADFQDMLQQFKRGIEENLDEEDSQAHYDLGVAFKEMGLVDEAIAEFQKALRGADTKLQSAEMLGLCFYEKGQFQVAATVLKRAVEGDPSSDLEKIGLLYWLGRCEQEQNRIPEALSHYQRVFALDIKFQDVAERVNNLVET